MQKSGGPTSISRKLLWLGAGLFIGFVIAVAVLSVPSVQTRLLRYTLEKQSGGQVEIGRIRVGPTGATAQEVKVRLPNFAIEARALRLAVSPWQLLTRRRLAINAMEARDLQLTSELNDDPFPPFNGLLELLAAPLDWAVTQASAEGKLTLVPQGGGTPIAATFKLRGSDLAIERPGALDLEFEAPGNLVAGWTGNWKFAGKLAYEPAPGGKLKAVEIRGTITPAAHPAYRAFPMELAVKLDATADGERYVMTLAQPDAAQPELRIEMAAGHQRGSGSVVRGTWKFRSAESLAAHFLQLADSAGVALQGDGQFSVHAETLAVAVDGRMNFASSNWMKLAPAGLAGLGAAEAVNNFKVTSDEKGLVLHSFDASVKIATSDARISFAALRPQSLQPFEAAATPWGRLQLSNIPLSWAAPFLPGVTIEGGAFSGAWEASTPTAEELLLAPVQPVTTGEFKLAHPALPQLQPLALSLAPVLAVTPDAARLELARLRLTTTAGDRIDIDASSTVDFAKLSAALDLRWSADLPAVLGKPGEPFPFAIQGTLKANTNDRLAVIEAADVNIVPRGADSAILTAKAVKPIRYDVANRLLETTGELGKLTATDVPLDWLKRFAPALSISGRVAQGESVLSYEPGRLQLHTTTPWTLSELNIAEGAGSLLREGALEFSPTGTLRIPLTSKPEFDGRVKLTARVAEVASVRDPAGPLSLTLVVAGAQGAAVPRLDELEVDLKAADGRSLLALRTRQAMSFHAMKPKEAGGGVESIWFEGQTGRIPLAWFKDILGPDLVVDGDVEPTEFTAQGTWPEVTLKSTKPAEVRLHRVAGAEGVLLQDVRILADYGVNNNHLVHAFYVENVKGIPAGSELGSLGSGYVMYFQDNFTMPLALSGTMQVDLSQWQNQPAAIAFSAPKAGRVTVGYEHDIMNEKKPTFSLAVDLVPRGDGKGNIAPLNVKATMGSGQQPNVIALQFEVGMETAPRPSRIAFDANLDQREKTFHVSSKLHSEFLDLEEFGRLVAATDRTVDAGTAGITSPTTGGEKTKAVPAASASAELQPPVVPLWNDFRGRFDLDLKELAYGPYRIHGVTGALEMKDETLEITGLSGRMFDGTWGGDLRVDFRKEFAASPYKVSGGFRIRDMEAARIVEAVYPDEPPMFTGRLQFDSSVSSESAWIPLLISEAKADFAFRGDSGRLRVAVPHAELASSALVFGGAITLSPEIRALGRLVRQFSDMPVNEISIRGNRAPDGLVSLEEFRVQTPQLRLMATGKLPPQGEKTLLERNFEMPVVLGARAEIATILKGMRLLESKPGADGYFPVSRVPKLKGTLGQPDTTELFDMLAHAADKSTGTFGFLMRKLQKEVQKAR